MKKRRVGAARRYLFGVLLVVSMVLQIFQTGIPARTEKKIIEVKAQNTVEKVRIGYIQTMEYGFFAEFLLKLAEQMEKEGSIAEGFSNKYSNINYEAKIEEGDTKKLWEDICANNVEGARYQFVKEAFFDMNLMKEDQYETMANRDDVDLMFAMGTHPGVYMKEHEKKNNYMVIMAADPVASGIVKSKTERFTDNSYAEIDDNGYRRQIRAGIKFLHFKKLGIVYEDSEDGRLYAALDIVEEESEKLGFEVLTEVIPPMSTKDKGKKFYKDLKKAYRNLIDRGMDTLYITASGMDYNQKLREVLSDSILPNKIKTLGQDDKWSTVWDFSIRYRTRSDTYDGAVGQIY